MIWIKILLLLGLFAAAGLLDANTEARTKLGYEEALNSEAS